MGVRWGEYKWVGYKPNTLWRFIGSSHVEKPCNEVSGREKAEVLKPAPAGPWKRFARIDAEGASAWTSGGGIALGCDDSIGHLYARTEVTLVAAAVSIGCNRSWIQGAGTERPFYQLRGVVLDKALALCARGAA